MKRLYSNLIDLTGFDCDDDDDDFVDPPKAPAKSPRNDPLSRSSPTSASTNTTSPKGKGSGTLSDWWGSAASIIPAVASSAARIIRSPTAALASVVSSVQSLSPKSSAASAHSYSRTDSFSMSTSPSASQPSPSPSPSSSSSSSATPPAPATPGATRILKQPCVDLSLSDDDSPLPSIKTSTIGLLKAMQPQAKMSTPKYDFSQKLMNKPVTSSISREAYSAPRVNNTVVSTVGPSSNTVLKENKPPLKDIKVEKPTVVRNSPVTPVVRAPAPPPPDDIDNLLASFSKRSIATKGNDARAEPKLDQSKDALQEATDDQIMCIERQIKRRLNVGEIDSLHAEMLHMKDRYSFRRLPGLKSLIRLLNDSEPLHKCKLILILRTILSFSGNWTVQYDILVELGTIENQLRPRSKGSNALIDDHTASILNECISKLIERSEGNILAADLTLLQESAAQGLATTSFAVSNKSFTVSEGRSDVLLAIEYVKLCVLSDIMLKAKTAVDWKELNMKCRWGNLIHECTKPDGSIVQAIKKYCV